MKAFKKYRALWDFTILIKRRETKKAGGTRVKKKSSNKKKPQKVSFKDSLLSFKSVSCISQYTRETERPKKTSKPRDRAREKKQQRAETFLWSKKRDASLSEFWDVLARKVWITLSSTSSSSSRALKSNRERSPFSSRRRRRQRVKTTKWWSEIIILVLLEAKEGRTKSARRSRTCWCLFYRLRFSIA